MPVINQRYKNGNYVKIDKEKENMELKKRLRSSTKDITSSYVYGQTKNKSMISAYLDKSPQSKIPPAWERLSKLKRVNSNAMTTNQLKPCRSQHNLMEQVTTVTTTPSNRPNFPMTANARITTTPPLANTSSPSTANIQTRNSNRKINSQRNYHNHNHNHNSNNIVMPDVEKEAFTMKCERNLVKNCKTNDNIIMDCSTEQLNKPKHLNRKLEEKEEEEECVKMMRPAENSEDSLDEYRSASDLLNPELSETSLINGIKQILQRKQGGYVESTDFEILNKMIKTDDRNSELFKDILRSQLDDIVRSQMVLNNVLKKLNVNECQVVNTGAQTDQMGIGTDFTRKLEVDVVFKNIPSLEKELIILRAIGQKLESGLKNPPANSNNNCGTILSAALLTDTYSITGNEKSFPSKATNCIESLPKKCTIELKTVKYLANEINEKHSVIYYGKLEYLRMTKGVAREFCIADKTIMELKKCANQTFYIPSDSENLNLNLRQTSFLKLKSNPDELMRHIKSKNPYITFNILDHDPIFFNSVFYHKSQPASLWPLSVKHPLSSDVKTVRGDELPLMRIPHLVEEIDNKSLVKVGDKKIRKQQKIAKKDCKTEEMKEEFSGKKTKKVKPLQKTMTKDNETPSTSTSTAMKPGKIRNRNQMAKTLAIGLIQLLLFLILIVVFTLPDMSCKVIQ